MNFQHPLNSKQPNVGTTIFAVMTGLANQHGAVNLAQGFPNVEVDPALISLVDKHSREGKNQYAPMPGLPILKEKIAAKIEELYGAKYHPINEILITAGATQAIYASVSAIVFPGDEVIVIEPAYDCYEPAIKLNGGVPVRTQLTKEFKVDWSDIKSKISAKTRAIMINTPHNPTGSILRAEDLQTLEKIVKDTNIIIISDEVYEHLVFDGERHESVCRYPALAERSIVMYSFGKTYHVTGWRMGYCVAPENIMKEIVKCHQFQTYCIHTPSQYAIADYLDNKEKYLELNNFFQQKRDYFLSLVKQTKFKVLPCEGTYFQLLSYAHLSDENDREYANRLTIDYKIASIPISVFYHNFRDDKILRFCFAKTNETLDKGVEGLMKVK